MERWSLTQPGYPNATPRALPLPFIWRCTLPKRSPKPFAGFQVQRRMCATCIYRPETHFDIVKLESEVAEKSGRFNGHRICHHSKDVCCAGFWTRHKDKFALGQLAQRLGFVRFVDVDDLK